MKRLFLFLFAAATTHAAPILDGINIRLDNYGAFVWPNGDAYLYSYNTGTDRKTVFAAARNFTIAPGGENQGYACLQLGNTDAVHDYVRIQRDGYASSTRQAVPSKQWFISTSSYYGSWQNAEIGFQAVSDEQGNTELRFFTQARYGWDGYMTGNLVLGINQYGLRTTGAFEATGAIYSPTINALVAEIADLKARLNALENP